MQKAYNVYLKMLAFLEATLIDGFTLMVSRFRFRLGEKSQIVVYAKWQLHCIPPDFTFMLLFCQICCSPLSPSS